MLVWAHVCAHKVGREYSIRCDGGPRPGPSRAGVPPGCRKRGAVRRYADGDRGAGEPIHLVGVEFGKAEVSVD